MVISVYFPYRLLEFSLELIFLATSVGPLTIQTPLVLRLLGCLTVLLGGTFALSGLSVGWPQWSGLCLMGVLCFLGRWHSCPSKEGHSCFLAREVFTTLILADEGFAFVFESVKSFALVLRGNIVTSPWYPPKKLTMSIIFVTIVRTYTDCAYCVLGTVLRSSHGELT